MGLSSRSSRVRAAAVVLALAAATALAPPAAAQDADLEEKALSSLIDAELAFAKMGLEEGIRPSFIANFAPDGVIFGPAPVRLVETWSKRPPNPNPKALRLEWAPAQAGIARSLDMGYTVGPSKLTDTTKGTPPQHGVFFSVWKRDGDGPWKVLLDIGIDTPQPVDFAALGPAPRPRYKGRDDDPAAQKKALTTRESRTFATAGAAATAGTYADTLAPDVRLHRDGAMPLAGRAAVARALRDRAVRVAWTPQDVRVATSGDLAVSHGKYREVARSGKAQEGYYVHLWLRDAAGRWRIAYDIALPAPPPAPAPAR